jgi:hypothetical protein
VTVPQRVKVLQKATAPQQMAAKKLLPEMVVKMAQRHVLQRLKDQLMAMALRKVMVPQRAMALQKVTVPQRVKVLQKATAPQQMAAKKLRLMIALKLMVKVPKMQKPRCRTNNLYTKLIYIMAQTFLRLRKNLVMT